MDMLDLIEKMEPKFIEKAEDYKPKKKNRIIYPVALAACACIVILAAIPISKNSKNIEVSPEPVESVEPSVPVESAEPSPAVSDEPQEIAALAVPEGEPLIADTSVLDWGAPEEGERASLADIPQQSVGGGSVYSIYAMSFDDIYSGAKEGKLEAGETLPVFKAIYPINGMYRDPELVTDDVHDRVLKELDAFVSLTGLPAEPSEIDKSSYNWDEYAYLNPVAVNSVGGCEVHSFLGGLTVHDLVVDISQENWLDTALSENVLLRTMLEVCGITDPHITYKNSYPFYYYDFDNRQGRYTDVEENHFERHIYITQDSDNYRDYLAGSVFSAVQIHFFEFDGSTTAELSLVRMEKPVDYTCCGEYEVVTYDEAVAQFCEETGLTENDIVGYELNYSYESAYGNHEASDYYIPTYIFYFESDEYNDDIWSGTLFDGWAVRAVRD